MAVFVIYMLGHVTHFFNTTCDQKWLFQVSTGRSGSTTLAAMLNELPDVYIAGEQSGMLRNLYNMHDSFMNTIQLSQGSTMTNFDAWSHNELDFDLIHTKYRELIAASIGVSTTQHYNYIGLKDILWDVGTLTFIAELFPCSRFIINLRRNTTSQHESQFHKANSIAKLNQLNIELTEWAIKYNTRVYQLDLEDFHLNNFNKMASWLGFKCFYNKIAHANNGGYNGVYMSNKTVTCI